MMQLISFKKPLMLIILLISSLSNLLAESDSTKKHNFLWINIAGGGGSYETAFSLSLNKQNGFNLWNLRFLEVGAFKNDIYQSKPELEAKELAFMYGLVSTASDYVAVSFTGGISFVYGINHGKYLGDNQFEFNGNIIHQSVYEKVEYYTAGISVDLQISLKIFKGLGLGLEFFANENFETRFLGAMIAIQYGFLRN